MSRKMYLTADDYVVAPYALGLNRITIDTYVSAAALHGATIEITLPEPEKSEGEKWVEDTRSIGNDVVTRLRRSETMIAQLIDDIAALKKERA